LLNFTPNMPVVLLQKGNASTPIMFTPSCQTSQSVIVTAPELTNSAFSISPASVVLSPFGSAPVLFQLQAVNDSVYVPLSTLPVQAVFTVTGANTGTTSSLSVFTFGGLAAAVILNRTSMTVNETTSSQSVSVSVSLASLPYTGSRTSPINSLVVIIPTYFKGRCCTGQPVGVSALRLGCNSDADCPLFGMYCLLPAKITVAPESVVFTASN
jgi:hypothetical protein